MLELKKKVGSSILPGGTQGIKIHYEGALFLCSYVFTNSVKEIQDSNFQNWLLDPSAVSG